MDRKDDDKLMYLGDLESRRLINSGELNELYRELNPESVKRVLKRRDRYG